MTSLSSNLDPSSSSASQSQSKIKSAENIK